MTTNTTPFATINGVPIGPLFGGEPPTPPTPPTPPAPPPSEGPLTVEDILAALQELVDAANDRLMTDEEMARYEQLEGQLRAVQRSVEIRSRQAAYMTPTQGLASVVHVGTARRDDTLERAFNHYLRTGH